MKEFKYYPYSFNIEPQKDHKPELPAITNTERYDPEEHEYSGTSLEEFMKLTHRCFFEKQVTQNEE